MLSKVRLESLGDAAAHRQLDDIEKGRNDNVPNARGFNFSVNLVGMGVEQVKNNVIVEVEWSHENFYFSVISVPGVDWLRLDGEWAYQTKI